MQFLPQKTNAELIKTLPIAVANYSFYIAYQLALDLKAGDIVSSARAQFELTNDNTYNVMLAHRMILTQDPKAIDGGLLAEAAGENITHDMHHGFRTVCGVDAPIAQDGKYYLSMIIYAASTAAKKGAFLTLQQGYGHLACAIIRP